MFGSCAVNPVTLFPIADLSFLCASSFLQEEENPRPLMGKWAKLEVGAGVVLCLTSLLEGSRWNHPWLGMLRGRAHGQGQCLVREATRWKTE